MKFDTMCMYTRMIRILNDSIKDWDVNRVESAEWLTSVISRASAPIDKIQKFDISCISEWMIWSNSTEGWCVDRARMQSDW